MSSSEFLLLKAKQNLDSVKNESEQARRMVSYKLRKDVIKELKNLTVMFNQKTKLSFSCTKVLEMIIMNESRMLGSKLEHYLFDRSDK